MARRLTVTRTVRGNIDREIYQVQYGKVGLTLQLILLIIHAMLFTDQNVNNKHHIKKSAHSSLEIGYIYLR